MGYFPELEERWAKCLRWLELRKEQGVDLASERERLSAFLNGRISHLERMSRPRALAAKEPDDLDAIRRLRPKGPRQMALNLTDAQLRDRLLGAWLGRAAGCILGIPCEGMSKADIRNACRALGVPYPLRHYWPVDPNPTRGLASKHYGVTQRKRFLLGDLSFAGADDDLAYTLLGLLILEEYGPDFTSEDVGRAWMRYLPMACTAEKVALETLRAGRSWRVAGVKHNPYMEWIGADIRSDPWGYACPGRPQQAAEMAYRDAYLSHRYNGLYGAMYFSAAIAAAFATCDPVEALHVGLTEIPRTCRLYADLQWAFRVAPKVRTHLDAWERVQQRFGPVRGGMSTVHTNNNACLTVWGVHIGRRDFTRAISTTVAMGYDNDCTAATVGSLVGAVIGGKNIPDHWHTPFRNRCRSYINGHEWFRIHDVCRRFARVAEATFAE